MKKKKEGQMNINISQTVKKTHKKVKKESNRKSNVKYIRIACRYIQKRRITKEKMIVKSIRLSNWADDKLEERKRNNKRNKEKATRKGM